MRKRIGIAVLLPAIAAVIASAVAVRVGGRRVEPRSIPESGKSNPFGVRVEEARSAGNEERVRQGEVAVEQFCSTCHVLPPADCQPKRVWRDRIEMMYGFAKGARPVQEHVIPPMDDAIRYFVSRAPEEFALPADALGSPPSPLGFRRREVTLEAIPGPPAVSGVEFVRLSEGGPVRLLVSDMRHGVVVLWDPSRPGESPQVFGVVPHPCRPRVVDLDGDGRRDLLVCNLGEFMPLDTDKGSLVWLRNRAEGRFEAVTLIDKLSRVADVAAADFNGDGKLDIVLAAFGQVNTGGIVLLENCTTDWSHPEFEPIPIDYRPGASDVAVTDLNGDGHPDFISLVSQEHEEVVAFVNRGWGSFRKETIYKAPHCAWASVGIRLLDLNGDGRTDVLMANGDQVEIPPILRPYHGLAWLENRGGFPFTRHRLTHMPGEHTILPADLDGDGRLDIVTSAFIPVFDPASPDAGKLDSVAWLRQTSPGNFTRHSLETGTPFHPVGDVGDLDGDGDVDIVMGNFFWSPNGDGPMPCLTVFENLRISAENGRRR